MNKVTAIILAGGKGTRMRSDVPKQYMQIMGKPLLWYTLSAFSNSSVDDIILVVGKGEEEHCQREIVDQYGFDKVREIVEGGVERYNSVECGLEAMKTSADEGQVGIVLIHDGARACITPQAIDSIIEETKSYSACIMAVPVKDTIKSSMDGKSVKKTLMRECLWMVQTPQAFRTELIKEAYGLMNEMRMSTPQEFEKLSITDDACVVETFLGEAIHITQGDYTNIKVTTPEDMEIARVFLSRVKEGEKNRNEKLFDKGGY